MKEKIPLVSSPAGSPIRLFKNSWDGGSSEDILSIAGGFHGNQLNGFYITARLIRFLQSIEEGTQNDYRLQGTIRIFPVVNAQAAQAGSRNWSFDGLDMDLACPGNEYGELGERLGAAILEHTKDSTFGIILSAADHHYEDAPHIKLIDSNRKLKKTARFLGLETAREVSDLPKTHLLYHWAEQDIPSFIITGGKTNNLDKHYCEKVFEGILSMMLATGLLTHCRQKPEKSPITLYTFKNETLLTTSQAGLFIAEVRAGDWVKPGQKIGAILDMYTGETLEEITATIEGVLVTLRDYPLVYERETIAVLLAKKEFPKIWPF